MTVPELIQDMLRRIRSTDWYHGREREFNRDARALQRAIARYGYACNERGWQFEPEAMLQELVALLRQIVEAQPDVKYFPIYLEGAVDRHIRTRAEELNAQAKAARTVPRLVDRVVAGSQVVKVIEPTAVELMDRLYRDLKPRKVRAARANLKQKELL